MPASLPESPRPLEAGRESPEASAAESRPGSTRAGTSGRVGRLACLRRIPATARWALKPGGRLSYRHLTGQHSGVTTTRISHLLDHLLSRVPENLLRSRGGCKGGGARRGGAAEDIVLEWRVEADARILGDDLQSADLAVRLRSVRLAPGGHAEGPEPEMIRPDRHPVGAVLGPVGVDPVEQMAQPAHVEVVPIKSRPLRVSLVEAQPDDLA